MRFADASRGRPFAKDPAVARFRGQYLLYYSLSPFRDGRANDGYAIGIAVSDDLEHWEKAGELLPDAPYEANGLCAPAALVRDEQLHLFYQTYGNGPRDAICHAVSRDGLAFTRDATNPIFSPTGDWNNGRAIDAEVQIVSETAFLYYATRDPAGRVQMLGLASSPVVAGFHRGSWMQQGNGPILRPELPWEQDCIEAPAICVHGRPRYLFYAGAYNNRPQQIGCAVSDDGVMWRRLSDAPFLPNGQPGDWNASESGHPCVFTDDGRTWLFFQGNNDGGATWWLAKTEIGWRDDGPYLLPEAPG